MTLHTAVYQVIKAGFILDNKHNVGDLLTLTDAQANYPLLQRIIAPVTGLAPSTNFSSAASFVSSAHYVPSTQVLSGIVTTSLGVGISGATVKVYIDGSGTATATLTTDSVGHWSTSLSLSAGPHTFTATALVPIQVPGAQATITAVTTTGIFNLSTPGNYESWV